MKKVYNCYLGFGKNKDKNIELNKEIFIYNMECYIIISENFIKPYGIYNDIKLAKEEYNNLTKRYVNASIYKIDLNKNIVDSKNLYTLICDNNIHNW